MAHNVGKENLLYVSFSIDNNRHYVVGIRSYTAQSKTSSYFQDDTVTHFYPISSLPLASGLGRVDQGVNFHIYILINDWSGATNYLVGLGDTKCKTWKGVKLSLLIFTTQSLNTIIYNLSAFP